MGRWWEEEGGARVQKLAQGQVHAKEGPKLLWIWG